MDSPIASVKERLNNALSVKGITAAELSRRTGISKGSISQYKNGVVNPKQDRIYLIANALGVSEAWLMGYDVPMSKTKAVTKSQFSNCMPIPQTKRVPMLGSVACGEPIYMDEHRGEYYQLDEKIRADFCLKAQGDSMIGARINDGDIVFIQASPEVENGQVAAVAIDDEATLKYFYQYGDTVVLRPANQKYPEMTYEKEELNHIRVLGRAVAFQSAL